jgi:SnoaL-like domain
MLDEIAIQQTLNRYSEGASRADWEQVFSTFTPDATWEIADVGARYQDHATIRNQSGRRPRTNRSTATRKRCCCAGLAR